MADLNQNRPSSPVGVRTVQRALVAGGQLGRKPAHKPLISKKNRKARLQFARELLKWTETMWRNVLGTDESQFQLFTSGVPYIRRRKNERYKAENTIPTSVMVWGAFIGGRVGPLHRIIGTVDAKVFRGILSRKMLPWARANCPAGWSFQQDNDPKHTSNLVKRWLSNRHIKWPSQSPDLNPIEELCEVLDQAVRDKQPRNEDDKFRILKEAWEAIPSDTLLNLVKSMPKRCRAVIKSHGYATKY